MGSRPADPGVEGWLALWQPKARRMYALMHYVLYKYMETTGKHTSWVPKHEQELYDMFPPDAWSIILPLYELFIWKITRQEIPVGCHARICSSNCTTVFCLWAWWWAESFLRQHPSEESLTALKRNFSRRANYNMPQPIVLSLEA